MKIIEKPEKKNMSTENNSEIKSVKVNMETEHKATEAEATTEINTIICLDGIGDVKLPKDVVGKTGDQRGKNQKKKEYIPQLNTVENPLNVFTIHKEANVMNEYTEAAMNGLVTSISKHGLLQPIMLWFNPKTKEWEVVDGRHRLEACNRLNKKIAVYKLPKKTKEDVLPEKILAVQIVGRGLDRIVANCEGVVYLERKRISQAALVREYNILKTNDIDYLKVIKRVRPLWFADLRNGEYITVKEGERATRALKRLNDICIEEERTQKANSGLDPEDNEITGDKETAIAFETVKPHVISLLSVVGEDEKRHYAMVSLISQNSKAQIKKFGMSIADARMKQLSSDLGDSENDNKRLAKDIKMLQNSISSLKSLNQELLEIVKLAPKNDIRIQTAMHNLGSRL